MGLSGFSSYAQAIVKLQITANCRYDNPEQIYAAKSTQILFLTFFRIAINGILMITVVLSATGCRPAAGRSSRSVSLSAPYPPYHIDPMHDISYIFFASLRRFSNFRLINE